MEAWRQYGGFYRLVDFTTSWTYDTPPIETRTLPTLPVTPTQPITPITPIQPISPIGCPSLERSSPLLSNSQGTQSDPGAGSSWRHSVLRPIVSLPDASPSHGNSPERNHATSAPGGIGDLELDDIGLGLQTRPVIDTANYDDNDLTDYSYGGGGGMGLGLLGLEVETTLNSPGSSRSRSRSQVQSMAAVEVPTTTVTEPVPAQKERKKTLRLVRKWFSSVKQSFSKRRRTGRNYDVENLENGGLSIPTPMPTISTPKPLTLALPQVSRSVSFINQQQDQHVERQELELEPRCEECDQAQKSGVVNWSRPLALREWKEWGYYARPWINGVFVNNYPPRPDVDADELSYAEIERLAKSLVDEHGNQYPEIWIPGVQHPSLPPCPPRWLSDPAPYWSGQCELNPYLRRKLVGEPPLFWDMGKDPATAVHGHNLIATPLLPPDRAQPATWPMTTHFLISALADDVEFKWPVLIRNKYGVTVQDVLEWIYANFQEAVDCDEWATWPMYLRSIATISYDKRGERDYLKRIDYLGFHSMFRGFEHSPDGQSWYLYVGRPY